ncbi:winged helix-turn-helix transcriptional regulator [Dietzia sp.]|uniref:winged helix-turn-helix transcriptional regulator n=1 Tax=Dietzia sp. TaxID=1871616 RepID=UPI002FD95D99
MEWLEQSTENCSIQRTLDVIGDKWAIQVLRESFRGVHRFDEMRDHLGISDSVLSRRLHSLVAEGVLERREYREEGARRRNDYRLTEKGRALYPTIVALLRWGDAYYADAAGPAVEIVHSGCGEKVSAEVRCAARHRLESPTEAETIPGPGALPRPGLLPAPEDAARGRD